MQRTSTGAALSGERITAALSAPTLARTSHFSLQRQTRGPQPVVPELSTDHAPARSNSVDNNGFSVSAEVGFVIPKRFARRAVTRNLIRRQMREAVRIRRLPVGIWLLRLRAPFDLRQFPSAASSALRDAVRGELDELLHKGIPA